MSPFLDTHHHFDFLVGTQLRVEFLKALAERDVRIVAQTLTPSSFMELIAWAPELAQHDVPLPLWSVGFHPWYITGREQAEQELVIFSRALAQTRFVGEIGLDFAPRRLKDSPAELQEQVLRRMLDEVCAAAAQTSSHEPYVLSIHAVRSAEKVLDILEEKCITDRNVVPVFHWFSGTSDELTRLMRLGGHVSIHPSMLTTKRGRAYIKQIPGDRLLLESDLPVEQLSGGSPDVATSAEHHADALAALLRHSLSDVSELTGNDIAGQIIANQLRLYAAS